MHCTQQGHGWGILPVPTVSVPIIEGYMHVWIVLLSYATYYSFFVTLNIFICITNLNICW